MRYSWKLSGLSLRFLSVKRFPKRVPPRRLLLDCRVACTGCRSLRWRFLRLVLARGNCGVQLVCSFVAERLGVHEYVEDEPVADETTFEDPLQNVHEVLNEPRQRIDELEMCRDEDAARILHLELQTAAGGVPPVEKARTVLADAAALAMLTYPETCQLVEDAARTFMTSYLK